MKQLLAILFCCLLVVPAYGAFGAATVWWVDGSTGSDNNGGAFDSGVGSPGTDESGTPTAITITLTGTTTGTCSPACSATAHGPGNFVHIASGTGCTVGWYEMLSQSAGTATFDRTMGSSTNVCVGVIGGNLATIGAATSNTVASNTVNVKDSATYSISTALSPTGGTSFIPTSVLGYHTSPGDAGNCTVPIPAAGCVVIQETLAINAMFFLASGDNIEISNFVMDCNSQAGTALGFNINANNISLKNITTKTCAFAGVQVTAGTGNIITQFRATGGLAGCTGGIGSAGNTMVTFVVTDNNNCPGLYFNSGINSLIDSLSYGNIGATSDGVISQGSAVLLISGGGFYGNGRDGIRLTAASVAQHTNISNTWLWGNVGKSIDSASDVWSGTLNMDHNAYASGSLSNVLPGPHDITLTADPTTNGASGDLSLNSTAGGGVALKAAGFPGILTGSTGFMSIGPIQPTINSGAGGGAFGFVQ